MARSNLFSGARLKIKRANKHIDELEAEIADFTKPDFCELFVEPDPTTNRQILKFHQTVPAPESIPLIVGDVFHNLRVALEHAAGRNRPPR